MIKRIYFFRATIKNDHEEFTVSKMFGYKSIIGTPLKVMQACKDKIADEYEVDSKDVSVISFNRV